MKRRMIAVPWDRMRMLCSGDSSECFCRLAYRAAGMIREAVETDNREDMVDATVVLKLCSLYLMPPAIKQHPRTRSILDKMLPSMLAWTIRISLFRSATILTYVALVWVIWTDKSSCDIQSAQRHCQMSRSVTHQL